MSKTNTEAGKKMTIEQICEQAEEAGRGAAMRAVNRGWSAEEQLRCKMEAEDATFLALMVEQTNRTIEELTKI